MEGLKGFLVLNWCSLALNTVLVVQTQAKFVCKCTWTQIFPPAFPKYHKNF